MAKTLLNDDELENVVGGAALELSPDLKFLTIDMTKDPDTSLETLIGYGKGILTSMGGWEACNTIKDKINANPNIAKCIVNISTFTPTYYDKDGNVIEIK